MSIALLDELLFWMRCRQLQREAREAAERFIEVLEGSERESRPMCMNDQKRKKNSSTKEEINRKRWAQEKCTTINNKSGFPTSRIPTNGFSTYWMLEMATRKVTVRVVM